jgi:lipoate-protein ligase A
LQHGSILWERSSHAPELPGIRDLTDADGPDVCFVERFTADIAARLGLDLHESDISEPERQAAEQFQAIKYAAPSWTQRR